MSAAPELAAARATLSARCDTIEECYEFMLAYAAQGTPTEGPQIRQFLTRCDEAIADLVALAGNSAGDSMPEAFRAFLAVVGQDAHASQAAVRLALAQQTISSPLVDNLNASIHIRALLTDLFLLDEALK